MDSREIGRRVQALRKRRGLTMRDLADRIKLSQGQVSRLENGRQGFRSDTLMRLAKALGVEPYYFYTVDEETGDDPDHKLLGKALAKALRQPDFVSVVNEMADANRHRPKQFRAIESVVKLILDASHSSDDG